KAATAVRRSAVLVSALLGGALVGSSGVWAQCADNFNVVGLGALPFPVQQFFPLGGGSTVSALTATLNAVNTSFLTTTSAFVSSPGNPQPDQQGSGAWGRAIGGYNDVNTSSVGTTSSLLGFPVTGSVKCDTHLRQEFAGYQVGYDLARLNSAGTGMNW